MKITNIFFIDFFFVEIFFDTSTDKFSLAIYKKNKIIYYYQKILNKDYSKKLIPIIQESLKKTRIKIEEIDFISISLGPGSFTGIRLGIAAAKGIALPYKIKILGFDNMELIADSIRKKVEKKLIIVKSIVSNLFGEVLW